MSRLPQFAAVDLRGVFSVSLGEARPSHFSGIGSVLVVPRQVVAALDVKWRAHAERFRGGGSEKWKARRRAMRSNSGAGGVGLQTVEPVELGVVIVLVNRDVDHKRSFTRVGRFRPLLCGAEFGCRPIVNRLAAGRPGDPDIVDRWIEACHDQSAPKFSFLNPRRPAECAVIEEHPGDAESVP